MVLLDANTCIVGTSFGRLCSIVLRGGEPMDSAQYHLLNHSWSLLYDGNRQNSGEPSILTFTSLAVAPCKKYACAGDAKGPLQIRPVHGLLLHFADCTPN